jgi:uncharacterized protein (TIGR02284 family)
MDTLLGVQMLDNEETISVINDLIEISKDGEDGFLKAAEDIKDSKIKSYLMRKSTEVKRCIYELQGLVRELGGKPTDSTSVAGYLHRKWIDLKTAIVNNDNLAILNELERGEDAALRAYREASLKDLPPNVAQIILHQLTGVQRNHDEIKEMRDKAQV